MEVNALDDAGGGSIERELHGPESSSKDVGEARGTAAVQAVVLANDVVGADGGRLGVVDVVGNRVDNGSVAHEGVLQSNAGACGAAHVVVHRDLVDLGSGSASFVGEDGVDLQRGAGGAQRGRNVLDGAGQRGASGLEIALKVLCGVYPLGGVFGGVVAAGTSASNVQIRLVANLPELKLALQRLASQRHCRLQSGPSGGVVRAHVELVRVAGAGRESAIGLEEALSDALPCARVGIGASAGCGGGQGRVVDGTIARVSTDANDNSTALEVGQVLHQVVGEGIGLALGSWTRQKISESVLVCFQESIMQLELTSKCRETNQLKRQAHIRVEEIGRHQRLRQQYRRRN